MSNFFKGTSIEQDIYYKNKYLQEIKNLDCPQIYNIKIEKNKILTEFKMNEEVIKKWIELKTKEILQFDDEILNKNIDSPNPKELQKLIEEFLGEQSQNFVTELWQLIQKTNKKNIQTNNDLEDEIQQKNAQQQLELLYKQKKDLQRQLEILEKIKQCDQQNNSSQNSIETSSLSSSDQLIIYKISKYEYRYIFKIK